MSVFLIPTAFHFVYVEFCLPSNTLAVLPTFSCADLIRLFIPLSKLLVKALNKVEVVQLSMKYPSECIFSFWKGTTGSYSYGNLLLRNSVWWLLEASCGSLIYLSFCSFLTSLSYWVMSKAFAEIEPWHWFLLPCPQGLLVCCGRKLDWFAMICFLPFICFSTFGGFTDGVIYCSSFLITEHDRFLISSSSFFLSLLETYCRSSAF